jgi:hypothetical protein
MGASARRGKAGSGKGGCGAGPSDSSNKGDYHEAFENSGYFKREGASASFHVSKSGSRTDAPQHPTQKALDWLAFKESKGALHNWGGGFWHYPKNWPDHYWKEGKPCCPPQVEGRAEKVFKGALGVVFTYLDLEFEYTGRNPEFRCKPHWRPHPVRKQGRGSRGPRPGRGARREPQAENEPEEEDHGDPKEHKGHKASEWFT